MSNERRQIEAGVAKIKSLLCKLEIDLGIRSEPSLKQRALDILDQESYTQDEEDIIRQALRSIPDGQAM